MASKEFFISPFQKDIWTDSYKDKHDKDIVATCWRQVNSIFKNESHTLKDQLFQLLYARQLIFGGRVTANIGTDIKKVFAFNCYAAQRSVKPYDSIKNIFADISNSAEILKTEGGIGFNFNHIRPRGTLIKGVGVGTPGVVKFMEINDKVSEVITEGYNGTPYQSEGSNTKTKIRKGAMMGMLSIRHPEIMGFIEAKKIPGRLTKFNLSVIVTDKFMEAVVSDSDWDLWYPNIKHPDYDEIWKGDFEEWDAAGLPKVIYQTIKARELWNFLMKNAYNKNEPGIYFIDNANRFNNLIYYQKVTSTNPCGEISMLADAGCYEYNGVLYEHLGDICNLGSINLTAFWYNNRFDFESFKKAIILAVRGLDNLIDISGYPLEGLKNSAFLRRKIGVGLMGYGSLLMMMGLRYGSEKANEFTENLMSLMTNTAYQTSALLAKEKGTFPLYNAEQIFKGGFIANSQVLNEETIDLIRAYGLRNSQLLTCAPTGTTSIYAGMVSGGIEPVIDLEYYRYVTVNHKFESLLEGKVYPKWDIGEWFETDYFKFEMRGEDQILVSKDKEFQIVKGVGLKQKTLCEDYGWTWIKDNLDPATILMTKEAYATSMELSVKEHMDPLKIFSRYIDNSISKTINLKADYPFEDFNDIFIDAWKSGVRGFTVYREGTMNAVLESKKEGDKNKSSIKKEQKEFFDIWKAHENDNIVFDDVELPTEYPMQGYVIKSEGKKWYCSLAFKDKGMTRPFAIFVKTNNRDPKIAINNAVQLLNELAISSGLRADLIDKNLEKIDNEANYNKLTRMLSFLLRHNVKIPNIVKCLEQVEDIGPGHFVYRITKFLYKFIDEMENGETCPQCGATIRLSEGCKSCPDCSWSKC